MENTQPIVRVRRATPDDFDGVCHVVSKAWSADKSEALPEKTVSGLTADGNLTALISRRLDEFWLADCSGSVRAVLGADNQGHIWALYVHPDHQRTGLGTTLLETAQNHFRDQGLTALSLDIIEDNTAARDFYTVRGWIEQSRREENLPGHTATVIRYVFIL